jgi:hypothetical protein
MTLRAVAPIGTARILQLLERFCAAQKNYDRHIQDP